MSLHGPTTTIDTLPANVLLEIFSVCRMDEVGTAVRTPWNWQRLAHVCRTWRHIMFVSSHHLRLELLCTHGTPVKKDLGHLPAFPIVVSYLDGHDDRLGDNLFAALEHRDRVRVVEVNVPDSLLEELATVMQEPFPALTDLWFESDLSVTMPALPDTFLGGSAPSLQTIYMSGIPFPAAPTLLSSARDLVDVDLRNIPPTGCIPPEAMAACLGALPGLMYLTFEFEWDMSYPDRMHLLPTTRTVLPALVRFHFTGLFEYFEDLVAQIDTPQLISLQIEYLEQEVTDFQIPQLCKFIDRSENFDLSRFRHGDLSVQPDAGAVIVRLYPKAGPSFRLSVQERAIGQIVNQIPAIFSNMGSIFVDSKDAMDPLQIGDGIQWLELFRPFTAVKALCVDDRLSRHIPLALNSVAEESAAEVLPALELLCLESEPVTAVEEFVAARQIMGRPVTVFNKRGEFERRFLAPHISEFAKNFERFQQGLIPFDQVHQEKPPALARDNFVRLAKNY
ncbi:hypothetical protein EDB89DRAFT_2235287 [Lactarius sanguifluus]|nr:hypothetical protein EDB89DRAFT_2235287 [Lactarius sanguifluus]